MNTIQTKALVLKTCNMNDNDKLVTLFCLGYGRMTAIAKGVRSHKHKDFSSLQQFCYSDIILTSKQGGLYTVSSSQVVNNFFDLRNDVLKVSFASYYMDVLADIAQDIADDEEYLKFILNTLYLTEKADNSNQAELELMLKKLKAVFEIKTACVMGVMPQINHCIACGKDKKLDCFSVYDGGVVCSDCVGRYSGGERLPVQINNHVLKVIDFIIASSYRSVFSFSITPELMDMVLNVSEGYLMSQLDTFYKSLSFLHKLLLGKDGNNN